MRELRELEEAHPELVTPTRRPSGPAAARRRRSRRSTHREPMLSLDNAFSRDELVAWDERLDPLVADPIRFVGEPKLDGLAISLLYDDGRLVARRDPRRRRSPART